MPFPESALNEEAGRLFMESYNEYYSHAAMMNRVHAAVVAETSEDIKSFMWHLFWMIYVCGTLELRAA